MRADELSNPANARLGIAEVDRQEPVRMDARERVRLLGRDGDVDVEPPRRLEKVGRAIRRRRQEKEDPSHGAILSPARVAPQNGALSHSCHGNPAGMPRDDI